MNILDVDCNIVCAMRLCNDVHRLLFICVYMSYEGSEYMTDEFADQTAIMRILLRSILIVALLSGEILMYI